MTLRSAHSERDYRELMLFLLPRVTFHSLHVQLEDIEQPQKVFLAKLESDICVCQTVKATIIVSFTKLVFDLLIKISYTPQA